MEVTLGILGREELVGVAKEVLIDCIQAAASCTVCASLKQRVKNKLNMRNSPKSPPVEVESPPVAEAEPPVAETTTVMLLPDPAIVSSIVDWKWIKTSY